VYNNLTKEIELVYHAVGKTLETPDLQILLLHGQSATVLSA
jgi:hypothetical protein